MIRPPVSTATPHVPEAPVLLVEDKDSLRLMLRRALEGQGHVVVEARSEPEAVDALRQGRPAVVLSDLRLSAGDGLGVLRAAKAMDPSLPVIVMTAYGGVRDAVTAIKAGAEDFLSKPVDPERLLQLVERAIDRRHIDDEFALFKQDLASRPDAPEIGGDHPSVQRVCVMLQRAAASDATVLLEGESGTGKELFARALHALSPRGDGPFVAINCAAIPETLLESELFGHERGAFTGAVARKLGRFEGADGGTLFLDEIGDLPLGLQAKILRALETRSFERVGGTAPVTVDVRIVAATNRSLKAAVAAHEFREDLYFRLSVFPITIPPLRDRGTDALALARRFVGRFAEALKRPSLRLSAQAQERIQRHAWPGNVRELQNCIERAVIMSEGDTIDAADLALPPSEAGASDPGGPGAPSGEGDDEVTAAAAAAPAPDDPWSHIDLSGTITAASKRVLAEVERRKIVATLEQTEGDRVRASELLQMKYKTLLAKMRDYRIA